MAVVALDLLPWDVVASAFPAVWVIVGPRSSGKTTAVCDIVQSLKHRYQRGCVVIGGLPGMIPDPLTDEFAGPEWLVAWMGPAPHIDQCVSGSPEWLDNLDQCGKSDLLVFSDGATGWIAPKHWPQLLTNSLHSSVVELQYLLLLPEAAWNSVQYVLLLRENNRSNQRRVWERFTRTWTVFASFEIFKATMDACTTNFGCLVLDLRAQQAFRWRASFPAQTISEFIHEQKVALGARVDVHLHVGGVRALVVDYALSRPTLAPIILKN